MSSQIQQILQENSVKQLWNGHGKAHLPVICLSQSRVATPVNKAD